MKRNLRRSVMKKMIKLSMSKAEAEDHTEVEAGAEDAHSTKQQSSVTTTRTLDISDMNVQMGTMEHILQRSKKRMKFFSWHMWNFKVLEEEMCGSWTLGVQIICVEKEVCSQA